MKILVIAPQPFYRVRGTCIAVRQLIIRLIETGNKVKIMSFPFGEDPKIDGLVYKKIPKIPLTKDIPIGPSAAKIFYDILLLFIAIKEVILHRYDVIHAVEEAGFFIHFLKLFHRGVFVFDMDSIISQQLGYSGFFRKKIFLETASWIEKKSIRRSDFILSVSPDITEHALKFKKVDRVFQIEDFPITRSDIEIAPSKTEELRKKLDLKDGKVILYTGNLEKYQGIELLLKSIPFVIEKIKNIKLVIVGGKREQIDEYKNQANSMEISDKVVFMGFQDPINLPYLYHISDILVSPRNKGENIPLKLYDYLNSGVPVVATDLPMHSRIMDKNVGVLVKPEPTELAKGMIRILEDPELAKSISENARKLIENKYSLREYNRKADDCYNKILEFSMRPNEKQEKPWHLKLSSKSIKKLTKLETLKKVIPDCNGKLCIEIGAEKGAVTYFLRQEKGGKWFSGILDHKFAPIAKELLGHDVIHIDPRKICFGDKSFDLVLASRPEHVDDDETFFKEISRILKDDGELWIISPRIGRGMFLNNLKNLTGLTMEKYGHYREGYEIDKLKVFLQKSGFKTASTGSFSRFFSESIELALNAVYAFVNKGKVESSYRPTTEQELEESGSMFKVYNLVFPILRFISSLDALIPFTRGYVLYLKAYKMETES